jgi:Ca2+-transporting ATPase
MTRWHNLAAADALQRLSTDGGHGLNKEEATRRLAAYGPNELREQRLKSPWRILGEQLTATMVIILIIAGVLSAALGDYKDAVAIIAIVVLNALLGFRQEYRAEKAMAALKKLAMPKVKVRRSGQVQQISARELVPGDIVLHETGNWVPADCRLLESVNLRIQEAALTGESDAVEKDAQAMAEENSPVGDRRNMAYLGTVVAYGRGRAVVVATGMDTELGHIAAMIQRVGPELTPLQKRLNQLGRGLAIASLALVGLIFSLGLLRGENFKLMFLTSISIAVAAVPEGLPAVVTIVLALGAQRMLRRRALIRKLPAVETLGSVTVICSDKTGTLTENRMTVAALDVAGDRVELSQDGGRAVPLPGVANEQSTWLSERPALTLLLAGGALCNDAVLESDGDKLGNFHMIGDPTEGALLAVASRLGLQKAELEQTFPRVAERPFDSVRKRMTTIHKFPTSQSQVSRSLEPILHWASWIGQAPYVAFTKGAVDSLLNLSSGIWVKDRPEPLTPKWRDWILSANKRLAQNGMRVLGLACRSLESPAFRTGGEDPERGLIFVGLVGMIDPARPEAKSAVMTCKSAGIRPVMITGDHPLTAQHIARELGIAGEGRILTGQDLDRIPAEELEGVVEEVSVYARVSPEHKLSIVQALQTRGHIVAMTGDGVNDAPALKKADIGVAMGVAGTDVAKEAADMVLEDDNFATIVAAVEEGRIIYDNVRKFIQYLTTCNTSEILVMLLGPLSGMPLPLLPLQILWMNLVTDGLPALALGVEPAERNTMRRPPRPPNESVFSRGVGRDTLWVGMLMGFASLSVGYGYWHASHDNWQTMLFSTLTLSQMALALAVRSGQDSLFRIGLLSNRPLVGAVVLTFGLQLAVVYAPPVQGLFKTTSLSATDLALCLALSSLAFWAVEIEKWMVRRHAA